jgi:hypothetical protein
MKFSNILFITPMLFGILFILSVYNNNLIEATIIDLLFVFSIFLSSIVIFSFIIKKLIKNNTKSFLISSLSIIVFFTYIPIYNMLFTNQMNENETFNQIILFIGMLSIILAASFFLIKNKNNFEGILKILFVILLSLVIFNVVEIEAFYFTNYAVTDNSVKTFSVEESDLRDVYHIILDGHPSTAALKQYFNYDNSNFENFLKNKGFFVPKSSIGNYNMTTYAMPSILNMNYIDSNWESEKELNGIVKEMMDENSVTKNFERNGYKIISFQNEYWLEPSEDGVVLCDSNVRSVRLLMFYLDNTPIKIVKKSMFSLLDNVSNTEQGGDSFQPIIENRICAFKELANLGERFSEPMFVHAHLITPHAPIVFDANGNIINTRNISEKEMPKAYLGQLQYTDTKIQEIIDKLLEKEPKPIIIIQSDHGFRFKINEGGNTLEHAFLNFEAFYFPNRELDKAEYSFISPVNSFRILFNEYFGTDYEILENKSFIKKDSKFVDITDFVISNSVFKED